MTEPTEVPKTGGASDVQVRALLPWTLIAAMSVLGLFHVFHEILPHDIAIMASGICGIAVGAAGYRWGVENASRTGVTYAGALGGGIGLAVLHVLPLLH
jgi:hypothetical protein